MNYEKTFLTDALLFLKDKKVELEKEGLVPTLDEAILSLEHDCHASPEDGCDCGDRVGEINGVDSDDYRDNEEDR